MEIGGVPVHVDPTLPDKGPMYAVDHAEAADLVIDPSDPRAAQPGKLAQQVNHALEPEEIAAKMSFEAELKTFLGA